MNAQNYLTRFVVGFTGLRTKLLRRRPVQISPYRACILLPTGLYDILVAEPLLRHLTRSFPQARFDWVITDRFRSLITSSHHLHRAVSADPIVGPVISLDQLQGLAVRLEANHYDTCIIPSPSPFLSYLAWLAKIPQRIGLDRGGRSVALTTTVPHPVTQPRWQAILALGQTVDGLALDPPALNGANGTHHKAPQLHNPLNDIPRPVLWTTGEAQNRVTSMLIDEIGWDTIQPLIVIQPGGSRNGILLDTADRWPLERFVLLCNRLQRESNGLTILIGSEEEAEMTTALIGMISNSIYNLCGKLSWGEMGALFEVATLLISNQADQIYLAAAVGGRAIAIVPASEKRPNDRLSFGPEAEITFVRPEDGTISLDAVWAAIDPGHLD